MVSGSFREEFVEIMATVSSQDNSGVSDQSIPQWKRELILRRRTLVRTLPAGNSTVKLSRPSVIAAVRQPEQGTAGDNVTIKQRSIVVASNKGILDQERTDLNPRGRRSDHRGEPATAAAVTGNMRLVEHIADAGAEFVLNGVGVDNNSLNVDSSSVKVCVKMGEETTAKKISSTARPVIDNSVLSENNNCDRSADDGQSDSSEELEYGPGIVNKLRSKYLSMTLRESQNKGVRPSLVNLRRATSLENLLDSDDLDAGKPQIKAQPRYVKKEDASKPTVKPQKISQHQQRYRGLSRGNDSLKRARSVEALYRNELKGNLMNRCAFRHPLKSTYIDTNKTCVPVIKPLVNEDIIIVENKSKTIKTQTPENKSTVPQNQKMRTNNIAPEAELPPPDVVKTTMKIFEGSPVSKSSTFPGRSTSSNAKVNVKATYTPKTSTDKALPKGVNKPPRKGLAPTPEVRPFSPPNRLHPPDNLSTSIPPASPTSGMRKLKSPSPTIESKQAFFMGKDISDNEQPTPQIMLPNGKLNFGKDDSATNSGEDEVDGAVKTVPQTVLENIRKDGLSLQFSFNKLGNVEKLYLPSAKTVSHNEQMSTLEFVEPSPLKTVSPPHISNTQHGSAKQVGVIRPIVTTNKQQFNMTAAGREIEKNIINKEKLNEQAKNKVLIKKKTDEVIEGVNVNGKTNSEKQSIPSLLRSTKPNDQLQNSMVFNFINRKDPPPDYIPDDGLNLTPKAKYKHGEQGVLILDPSLSGDSSTDDFTIGPPSPCNVTFEGANILINGRSNLRKQPRASKLHISFNDSATTTFEYPSESSLLDNDEDSADSKSNNSSGLTLMSPQSPTPGVPVPLGGSSLASYTPSKVHLGSEDFQLGVTRASPAVEPASKAAESNNASAPETVEEEYLKPAEESETVAWSAETTADLLF